MKDGYKKTGKPSYTGPICQIQDFSTIVPPVFYNNKKLSKFFVKLDKETRVSNFKAFSCTHGSVRLKNIAQI